MSIEPSCVSPIWDDVIVPDGTGVMSRPESTISGPNVDEIAEIGVGVMSIPL